MVQKHAARNTHFDLRLEFNGVLKSWAVPRGPSIDPKAKRLAIEVEDHPLEYATFEGIIPKGQYGAGEVIVWDHGTWESDSPVDQALEQGKLRFRLHGQRLHGAWLLVRTNKTGKQPQWLLTKVNDQFAATDIDVVDIFQNSVLSSRAIPNASLPKFIEPMLPTSVATLQEDPNWIYELKIDGYRM